MTKALFSLSMKTESNISSVNFVSFIQVLPSLVVLSRHPFCPTANPYPEVEMETSVMGLGNRRGILSKLESVLNQDWESLEEIKARHESAPLNSWKDKLKELNDAYAKASNL